MTIDPELASWQRQWHEPGEQLPDLKQKIKRQDRRSVLQLCLVSAFLISSLVAVWHFETSFFRGLATGAWFSCLVMGAYVWRARRGTWRPAAQTTADYLALLHRRAVAKQRIAQFAFRFLLTATLLYAGFVAWRWRHFLWASVAVLAAMTAELFFLRHMEKRRKRDADATRQLLQSSAENSGAISGERQD